MDSDGPIQWPTVSRRSLEAQSRPVWDPRWKHNQSRQARGARPVTPPDTNARAAVRAEFGPCVRANRLPSSFSPRSKATRGKCGGEKPHCAPDRYDPMRGSACRVWSLFSRQSSRVTWISIPRWALAGYGGMLVLIILTMVVSTKRKRANVHPRTGQNRRPPRVQSDTRVGRSSLAYSLSLIAIRAQPLGRACRTRSPSGDAPPRDALGVSRRGASPLGLRVRQKRPRGCARIAKRDRL